MAPCSPDISMLSGRFHLPLQPPQLGLARNAFLPPAAAGGGHRPGDLPRCCHLASQTAQACVAYWICSQYPQRAGASELPRFIRDEFDAFLECGILAHGFLRLRCGECGHDKLLAFSCKRRGFCPSCGADGVLSFVEAGAPTDDELHALLQAVITWLMQMLTRRGVLVEDMGRTYLAEPDADGEEAHTLRSLQAAAVSYQIAFGARAGQKVLTLRGATPRQTAARPPLCADIDGFSLHAAVRVEAHERKRLEQLCRYITRPALSDERVRLDAAGQVELKPKTPWRDGTTHVVMRRRGTEDHRGHP